ncbi:hypothetical protein JRQ81_018999 [Phrynocephalus forsythii]|uniref:Uncharacterized protein n=1 Tax=Phrynocephalus forsythii TaxID=171643 RepID=A0A9Q1B048_9SAUR|nr:hypothetical protein JRQ81_018999 [Phrynocephalus forsythii]
MSSRWRSTGVLLKWSSDPFTLRKDLEIKKRYKQLKLHLHLEYEKKLNEIELSAQSKKRDCDISKNKQPEIRFLGKDKKPQNMIEAAKIEDKINIIRDSRFSEVTPRNRDYQRKPFQSDSRKAKSPQNKERQGEMVGSQSPKSEGREGKFKKGSPENKQKLTCWECLEEGCTRQFCHKLKNKQDKIEKRVFHI